MKLFDDNPQSKAMQRLIHDTRNLGDTVRIHAKGLSKWFKTLDPKPNSIPYVHLEYVTGKVMDIEKSIDAYYECFSKDFPNDLSDSFKPEIPTAFNLADEFLPEGDWKGDKLQLYKAFERLIEKYTLIRKS